MATGYYSEIGHVYIPATDKPTSSSVGYYDEKAAYLNRRLIEGRMLEKSGELAIEEGALARLNPENAGVGDQITLTLSPVQGAVEERTFTMAVCPLMTTYEIFPFSSPLLLPAPPLNFSK